MLLAGWIRATLYTLSRPGKIRKILPKRNLSGGKLSSSMRTMVFGWRCSWLYFRFTLRCNSETYSFDHLFHKYCLICLTRLYLDNLRSDDGHVLASRTSLRASQNKVSRCVDTGCRANKNPSLNALFSSHRHLTPCTDTEINAVSNTRTQSRYFLILDITNDQYIHSSMQRSTVVLLLNTHYGMFSLWQTNLKRLVK